MFIFFSFNLSKVREIKRIIMPIINPVVPHLTTIGTFLSSKNLYKEKPNKDASPEKKIINPIIFNFFIVILKN